MENQMMVAASGGIGRAEAYARELARILAESDWGPVEALTELLADAWVHGRQIFLCGNGGSAANAVHLANDFVYPVAKTGRGLRITSLVANPAIVTCLANDISYDSIFARQLEVFAHPGDLLIVLSGSGNSPNVVQALTTARELGLRTAAILGLSGGACLELAELPIHFRVQDMQMAEDLQLVVGHVMMQSLSSRFPSGPIAAQALANG